MRVLPTDRAILRAIYDRHYPDFVKFKHGASERQTKVYVPIDIPAVARDVGHDEELVFGRLYHHLNSKYSHESHGVQTIFFESMLPAQKGKLAERHVVNFPLMESVLATLELDSRKVFWPMILSAVSIMVAIAALIMTLWHSH